MDLVNSTAWSEGTLTANNSTLSLGAALGSLAAPTSVNHAYSVALSPSALQANVGGKVSMALTARTTDVLIIYAREAGAADAPQLTVTYK